MNVLTVACAIGVVLIVGAVIFEVGHARGFQAALDEWKRFEQFTRTRPWKP
jgi:hypothetical protein